MRKFNITVNGKTYEVEVEELGVSAPVAAAPAAVTAPAAAPVPAAAPAAAPAPKPAPAASADGETISCPMPGTILSVNIKAGDTVKTGDVLFILEAMKMENEIMAPHDARVTSVNVAKGASVNTGDVLAVLS
jgi:glutaconyl-CoA decarboxylase